MRALNNNPFRVLGTISNASLRELKSAEVLIKRYLDINEPPILKFDLTPPMDSINRTIDDIVKAKNQIHNSKDKLIHSFFWFISSGPIDNIALNKLTESKNIEEALETFRKGSKSFKISEKTATCILNHSSLELLQYKIHSDEAKLIESLKRKIELLSDESIVKYFEFLITGEKNKVKYLEIKDGVFDKIKSILLELFPSRDQTELLLSVLPSKSEFKVELEEGFIKDLVNKVNVETKKFDEVFESNKVQKTSKTFSKRKSNTILKIGRSLVDDTKSYFKELLKYLDKSDYQFENLINEVFTRANVAIIHVYNAELNYVENTSGNYEAMNYEAYVKDLEYYEKYLTIYVCDVKSTISKNLEAIKSASKGSVCWFCESNPASNNWSLKVQMYKMDFYSNSYSYFKNGGIPIDRCSSCASIHFAQKFLALIFTLATIGAIAWTIIGLFFLFGDLQNGFVMCSAIFRWYVNLFNFIAGKKKGCGTKKLEKNRIIGEYRTQGYTFSKP